LEPLAHRKALRGKGRKVVRLARGKGRKVVRLARGKGRKVVRLARGKGHKAVRLARDSPCKHSKLVAVMAQVDFLALAWVM
jgi:hypothetical protein